METTQKEKRELKKQLLIIEVDKFIKEHLKTMTVIELKVGISTTLRSLYAEPKENQSQIKKFETAMTRLR
jgi:hypothetical protein